MNVSLSSLPKKRLATLLFCCLVSSSAAAYEFLCSSYTINAFSGACAVGFQSNDQDCSCTTTTAPQWFGKSLAMRVENQGGNGISAANAVLAAQEAAAAWDQVSCSSFSMTVNQSFSPISPAPWGNSPNNSNATQDVSFVANESEWIQLTGAGGGGTLGVTVSPWQANSCTGRSFFDSDILMNGFVFNGWSFSDYRSTMLHEMGHSIGLGHSCLNGSPNGCASSCTAVMGASGGDYTIPQQDDVNAICALYPGVAGGLGSSCANDGQCNSGPCVDYEGFSYCSQTCTSTCPTGFSCTSVAGEGTVCVRQGAPGPGESCSGTCAEGAFCLSDGICHAECTTSTQCESDERCAALQGGGGICIQDDTQNTGEACGQGIGPCADGNGCFGEGGTGTCYQECSAGGCGAGFGCQQGYCFEVAGENESCSAVNCETGLNCTNNGNGGLVCRRSCDPSSADSCGIGQECTALVNGAGQVVGGGCTPSADALEGDSCLSTENCSSGLTCIETSDGTLCLKNCNAQIACTGDGQNCVAAGNQNVCFPAAGEGTQTGGPGGACTCDAAVGLCSASCACDPDCQSPDAPACSCDTTLACDPACGCDPECPCPSNTTTICDSGSSCDPDCSANTKLKCACDLTSICDTGCSCDPLCEDSGDEESQGKVGCRQIGDSGLYGLLFLVLLWRRPRRAQA